MKTIAQLFAELPEARIPAALAEYPVSAIRSDSRLVTPGDVFVAIPGLAADGRDFASAALAAGALAVAGEGECPAGLPPSRWIALPDARRAIAYLAAAAHDHPARHLRLFAVTGTNGKTTTATLLARVLNATGKRCGLIATTHCDLGGREVPASQTTPDALTLHRHFAAMLEAGCQAACIEVSSHALEQQRTAGLRFAAAAFTNLTQDHLDYHGSMEEYGRAKRKIFEQMVDDACGTAVVNIDDPWGVELMRWLRTQRINALSYGLLQPADIHATDLVLDIHGASFQLQSPSGSSPFRTILLGRHNVYNILAVTALASVAGVDSTTVARVLSDSATVAGRLERVALPDHPAAAFVDYAHTPDALANVLRTLREVTPGRLLVVFGCGGDRDRGKRPQMGRIAHDLADLVVVTSDNPRKEDPKTIITDILSGTPADSDAVHTEPDRQAATALALRLADRQGDVVLVAGKGHETEQIFADHKIYFDDREALLNSLPNS